MLAYTLFEILNASKLKLSYRYLRVKEKLPEDGQQPIRLQRWADELWQRRLKCPVFKTMRGSEAYFIVPADADLSGKDLTFIDVPNRIYHIEPTDEVVNIDLKTASVTELDFVSKAVERCFSNVLDERGSGFWRDTWTRFFYVSPANEANDEDTVNAFRGFAFDVTAAEAGRLFLAVDVRTRYAGRRSIAEYRALGIEEELDAHCNAPMKDRPAFLRDNGPVKFRCFYAGETGETISRCYLEELGQTVYEYYVLHYPKIAASLSLDDQAIFTKAKKADNITPIPVPASRLFPIFTTEYGGMRWCSIRPTMAPEERLALIQQFLKAVTGVRYENVTLDIESRPLSHSDSYFAVPRLEFGESHVLQISDLSSQYGEGYPIRKWGPAKMKALCEHGPFQIEPFPAAYLLYPRTLGRRAREELVKSTINEVKLQSKYDLVFTAQREYVPDPNGRDLLRLTRELQSKQTRALLVCILPTERNDVVYPRFKEACSPLFSQCLEERKVVEICSERGKLQNLALAILTSTGAKPWVMADSLNHDLHLGIDVLPPNVVYSYLFGFGGRNMLRCIDRTGGGRREEAIKKRLLREELVRGFREVSNQGYKPQTIVIHRDGRLWPKEAEGIDEAIQFLKEDGTLPGDARYCVAEIRKSHLPVRIFEIIEEDDASLRYQNPFPGCYLMLDKRRVILTTTGKPEEWDERGRTAVPLLVYVEHNPGNLDIRDVAQDIFRLCQLNWSAPYIDVSLPVTIRWADELLRETFIQEED